MTFKGLPAKDSLPPLKKSKSLAPASGEAFRRGTAPKKHFSTVIPSLSRDPLPSEI